MIVLAPLYLTTAFAFGMPQNISCTAPDKTAEYRVDLDVARPVIDHTVTRDRLKTFETATVSPYGNNQNVHVNGLMRGAISTESRMALGWQRTQDNAVNCFWYDNVSLKITLKPIIFIAREIPEGSCSYREVLNHEYRHYETDYKIAEEYQVIFKNELDRFLKTASVVGPYPRGQQEQVQQQLGQRIEQLVKSVNQRLDTDRKNRQALIDTRAEYERVAHACAGRSDL